MRCHAGQCTDPDSLSPEDAVDDGGMPAHPQCATYADEPHPCGHAERVRGCGGCDPPAVDMQILDDGTVLRPGDPGWHVL